MSTQPRIAVGANQDNTGRVLTRDFKSLAYGATVNVPSPRQAHTDVVIGQLTGNATLNVGVGSASNPPYVGDTLRVILNSDATNRTVTFGTGLNVTAATIVVTGTKKATVEFVFDGAAWVELSRTVTV